MVICVDIDDTIEDLLPVWLEDLNHRFGTDVKVEDVTDWGLTKHFSGHSKDELLESLESNSFWSKVKPKEDAVEALIKILSAGHDIYFVTAAHCKSILPKVERMLQVHFPFIPWRNIIIATNKQMIKCDIMIDDCPKNLIGGDYYKLLFNMRYNEDFDDLSEPDMVRVYSWKDICSLLLVE